MMSLERRRPPDVPQPPKAGASVEHDDEPASNESPRILRCRTCQMVICAERDFLTVTGSGPHVYVNPHGIVFELVTVRDATNLLPLGQSTQRYTWFAGYTWQVVVCANCTQHLGWIYEATSAASPPRFYGLIRAELVSSS